MKIRVLALYALFALAGVGVQSVVNRVATNDDEAAMFSMLAVTALLGAFLALVRFIKERA